MASSPRATFAIWITSTRETRVMSVDSSDNPSRYMSAEGAFQRDTSIHGDILYQIPTETTSVTNLIVTAVPQRLECAIHSPESCLSNLTPDWIPEDLWKVRVLPRTLLNDYLSDQVVWTVHNWCESGGYIRRGGPRKVFGPTRMARRNSKNPQHGCTDENYAWKWLM